MQNAEANTLFLSDSDTGYLEVEKTRTHGIAVKDVDGFALFHLAKCQERKVNNRLKMSE